jgi:hypothetical protein
MKLTPLGFLAAAICLQLPSAARAADAPEAARAVRDGHHDFDWELGHWDTQLQRLRAPLSGKSEWITYRGTTVVKSALDGRANLVELDVHGSAGRIAGVSLRLYRPASGEWFLHFANLANGEMTEPMHGSFAGSVGTFYGQDTLRGAPILVRFLIKPVNSSQWRFEQAYSADGGKTWEDNWIAVDTKVAAPPEH